MEPKTVFWWLIELLAGIIVWELWGYVKPLILGIVLGITPPPEAWLFGIIGIGVIIATAFLTYYNIRSVWHKERIKRNLIDDALEATKDRIKKNVKDANHFEAETSGFTTYNGIPQVNTSIAYTSEGIRYISSSVYYGNGQGLVRFEYGKPLKT
ncbi:hypothetical protein MUP05_00015 [Candidatus Bathyarchaeota archaeon]|nr:hypothetical protein [Candidatus Bathyarchaeota archaeon]